MRNLMKFNRFVMPLLLIIFSALLHGCTLNENVSYKSAYADNNLSVKNENINGAIVKVNDKYIYHDEINEIFLQQFGKVGVSYSDIVENSIDEIVEFLFLNPKLIMLFASMKPLTKKPMIKLLKSMGKRL